MFNRYDDTYGDWDDDYESTLDERYERKYARQDDEQQRFDRSYIGW